MQDYMTYAHVRENAALSVDTGKVSDAGRETGSVMQRVHEARVRRDGPRQSPGTKTDPVELIGRVACRMA